MSRWVTRSRSIRQVQRSRGLQQRLFCSTPIAKQQSHPLFPDPKALVKERVPWESPNNKAPKPKHEFDQLDLADLLARTKPAKIRTYPAKVPTPRITTRSWTKRLSSFRRTKRLSLQATWEEACQERISHPVSVADKVTRRRQRREGATKRLLLPETSDEPRQEGTSHCSYVASTIVSRRSWTKRLVVLETWDESSQEDTLHPLSAPGDSIRKVSSEKSTPNLVQEVPSETIYDADDIAMRVQGQLSGQRNKRQKKEKKSSSDHALTACGTDDVLAFGADELLKRPRPQISEELQRSAEVFTKSNKHIEEIMLEIEALSATGEGLGRHPTIDHVFVVPFTLVGEIVQAQTFTRLSSKGWDRADLVAITRPSALREGTTPQCKHFGKCSGCQLQMISYDEQLKHKKTIVEHAFQNFSGLDSSQYPTVEDTGGSPLQYGYRTKLTPHFEVPRKDAASSTKKVPPIGFNRKGFNRVMDIESCPISAPIIEEGLRIERAKVAVNIDKYKRGATLLLRETTERVVKPNSNTDELIPLPLHSLDPLPPAEDPAPAIHSTTTGPTLTYNHPLSPSTTLTDTKSYTTDDKAPTYEQIGSYTFATRAGSFFQNNNSILPTFLSHVRTLLSPAQDPPLKYLLDAYCGSGLFALTLAPLFTSVLGIEVDAHGVAAARANATRNSIANCGFVEADAAFLFADVPFPSAQTALVIDPPRKGCSVEFLRQLLMYGPKKVVYVSCNVNSQARDVGCLVRGWVGEGWWKEEMKGLGQGPTVGRWRYEIESLQGWDFFPQTAHVEGLCVLRRVENEEWKESDEHAEVKSKEGKEKKPLGE